MKTLAVLPVKSFGRAKSRTGLDDDRRAGLAEAMVGDVLAALADVDALAAIVVVTREPLAAEAARAAGALVLDDPWEAGHNPAAARGATFAVECGAERVLFVPGDCPGLNPAELQALLADPRAGVTVVPDRHGTGTNALLIAPPKAIEPSFGPGSFARHAAVAEAAGAGVRVADVPSLAFDVDTLADLAALPDSGPRTRAVLRNGALLSA